MRRSNRSIIATGNADGKLFRKEETGRKKTDFWFSRKSWDTVMDQYERTHSPAVKRQFDEIYDGFIKQYPDWTTNKYNDDIIWWAIACTRTSQTAASALAVVLCFADEEPKR